MFQTMRKQKICLDTVGPALLQKWVKVTLKLLVVDACISFACPPLAAEECGGPNCICSLTIC